MPGLSWFRNLYLNHVQEIPDGQMRDIPMPRLELHTHVMYKCVETGSILGLFVIGPLLAIKRKAYWGATMSHCGLVAASTGGVIAPFMTEAMLFAKKATPDSIWDRCYRLRYNQGQIRTDRWATWASVPTSYAFATCKYRYQTGFITGIALGTILAAVVGMIVDPTKPAAPKAEKQ